MNNSKFLLTAVFCFLFVGTVLVADSLIADESDAIYGKGVHVFFDRNYEGAVKILSEAEELKSVDPRPYYFLGLAYLKQKKTEQADQYFKKAADLEYSGRVARDYAVSESLRRIQGVERQQIEKIRAEARTNAQKQAQRIQEQRYGEKNRADRNILRQSSPQKSEEDLAALQQSTASYGGNTFGAKPIDPTNTSAEIIAVQRSRNNPFGEIVTKEDTLPEIVELKPLDQSNALASLAGGQENPEAAASPSLLRQQVQAPIAKELGRGLRSLFANLNKVEPKITAMEPAIGATDVDAATVKEIRITFDVDMDTESIGALTPREGTTAPKTGEPSWADSKTCVFPVELTPGQQYDVIITRDLQKSGFQSKEGVPARPVPYRFTTQ